MKQHSGLSVAALVSISSCAALGCESEREPKLPAASVSPIVAEYGGTPITLAELDASIAPELYRLRAESLHQLLTLRMERAAAQKSGLSLRDYRAREVDSKVPAPSDREMQAALDSAKQVGTVRSDTEIESVRAELAQFLTTNQRREEKEIYIDRLYRDFRVRMHLDAVGRPSVPLRASGPSAGPADAPVTIAEYTDFNGKFTALANTTIQRVLAEYPQGVRVLFRHKPQPADEVGMRAAEAALCAADQNRYWDYRQALFADQGNLARQDLLQRAAKLSLDAVAFEKCLDSGVQRAQIEGDIAEARRYGLAGSPVFSVNGTPLSGAHELRMFRRLIDVELGSAIEHTRAPAPARDSRG
jgi:hypothetical protein